MSQIRAVAGSCRVHVICTDCTSIYFLQHFILMWSYSNMMFASSQLSIFRSTDKVLFLECFSQHLGTMIQEVHGLGIFDAAPPSHFLQPANILLQYSR